MRPDHARKVINLRPPFLIQVALLRGTTADTDGNVSLEREAFYNDVLNMASPLFVASMIVRQKGC